MVLGILLVIATIAGIIYGVMNKNKLLTIVSVIVLLLTVAIWIFFYNNPY